MTVSTALKIALFSVGAALAASAAPLLVYTLSLAIFGLPHVLAELRYVDDRFGARLDRSLVTGIAALTAAAVLMRMLVILDVVPGGADSGRIELFILAALGALVVPGMTRAGGGRGLLGSAVCLGIGLAAIAEPLTTLVLLALFHNLTPIAFLAERLRGRIRRRALAWCLVLFALIPGVIATGALFRVLAALGLGAPEASLLVVPSLADHFGAFIPIGLRDNSAALHLFTAAVYLQVLHYGAVLYVLPRLASEREPGRWPRGRRAIALTSAVGAIFFCGFALSFGDAKAAYGLFALVHAWIELPLLMGALGFRSSPRPRFAEVS